MRTRTIPPALSTALSAALALAFALSPLHAAPPPGILNHQGRLVVSGTNYTGTGFFKFALVDAAGVMLWSHDGTGVILGGQPATAVTVSVSQGHYALGLGDPALANMTSIPSSVFTANSDVRLRVWFSANGTTFERLTPDRRLTSTGYALTAGAVADPSFVGTTTNTPLDFFVNGRRGLRVQPGLDDGTGAPNLIGGFVANTITAGSAGSVIGGGGHGFRNTIEDAAHNATIAGGRQNVATVESSAIGGGSNNRVEAFGATVPGGDSNTAIGITSLAAGSRAKALHQGTFVWSDRSASADFSSTAANEFSVRAIGGVRLVTGGTGVLLDGDRVRLRASAQTAGFSQATGFDFNTSVAGGDSSGLLIEQGLNESSGLFFDGDSISLWSPGDNNRLLRIFDEDDLPLGAAAAEKFYVDGAGGFFAAGAAVIGGHASVSGNHAVAGSLQIDANGLSAGTLPGSPGLLFGGSNSGEGIVSARTGGTNLFGLEFLTGYTSRLSITGDGKVGIGTRIPTRGKVEILGSVTYSPRSTSVGFSGIFATLVNLGSTDQLTSLYASHSIVTGVNIVAESDRRIKQVAGRSDAPRDLATLLGIEVTDYTLTDVIAHGLRPQKKVIAQQVETVFPQAVSRTTNVVPDIYQTAVVAEGWVQLATTLTVGDRVKLIAGSQPEVLEVLEVRDGAFRTAFQPPEGRVFVYGREVSDFRHVDYDAIAMLNVSATQELARQLTRVEEENAALKARLARLERVVEAIAYPATMTTAGQPAAIR